MSALTALSDRTWVDVQKNTFTNWANEILSDRAIRIDDLCEDLCDGLVLINLFEMLTGEPMPRHDKNPNMRAKQANNLHVAFQFIKEDGLKLVNIGPEDLLDGNLKIILGLFWSLIIRYQISGIEEGSPKHMLLEWVNRQLEPYPVDKVTNFKKSWQDGKALTALVDSMSPGISPLETMTDNPYNDIDKAMGTAFNEIKIPRILHPADMANAVDDLSCMTYISYFREQQENKAKRVEDAELARLRLLKTPDPNETIAYGPGLCDSKNVDQHTFTVECRNHLGDPVPTGLLTGDKLNVRVDGPQHVKVFQGQHENGCYPITYDAVRPGNYAVNVMLGDVPLKDSPYYVAIEPVPAKVAGEGVEGGRARRPTQFIVDTGLTRGGNAEDVDCVVTDPHGNIVPTDVRDNGDGNYTVTYTPQDPGVYQVEPTCWGIPCENEFPPPLFEVANSGKSYAEGPGLENAVAKREQVFFVHGVDVDGNHSVIGGETFDVEIQGPEEGKEIPVEVIDNNDGTYTVKYTPVHAGDHDINVMLHGKPIENSPVKIDVKPCADPSMSYAEGDGLNGGKKGQEQEFKIYGLNENGDQCGQGQDPFSVTITPETPHEIIDHGDSTYTVKYTPQTDGDHDVDVSLFDQSIKDMPCTVPVKAAPCTENCWADGPGLSKARDNEPAYFTVYARDDQDKPVFHDDVVVSIVDENKNPVEEVEIQDNEDGSYSVSYAVDKDGDYQIDISIDGVPIPDSPFHVDAERGTQQELITGTFTYTIHARDKYGKLKDFGGDDWEVSVDGPNESAVEVEARDNGNGSYSASYSLAAMEDDEAVFKVSCKLNGKHVASSPFKHRLNPQPSMGQRVANSIKDFLAPKAEPDAQRPPRRNPAPQQPQYQQQEQGQNRNPRTRPPTDPNRFSNQPQQPRHPRKAPTQSSYSQEAPPQTHQPTPQYRHGHEPAPQTRPQAQSVGVRGQRGYHPQNMPPEHPVRRRGQPQHTTDPDWDAPVTRAASQSLAAGFCTDCGNMFEVGSAHRFCSTCGAARAEIPGPSGQRSRGPKRTLPKAPKKSLPQIPGQ